MRILVAEDDAILAEGVMTSLRGSGYAVDWVRNGVEADSALEADAFDLLILDLGLPRRPGLEVLKRLRLRESRLPVLILTARDGVDDRVRGLDAGADDYLAKPFDLAELERSLGLPAAAAIPSDRLVSRSVNAGVPVVALSPRSRVARAFTGLAKLYLPGSGRKGS